MQKKRQPTIGVLTPYTGGFYYGAILEGIQKVAGARGVAVVAVQTTGMDLCWTEDTEDDGLGIDAVDGWIAVNEYSSDLFTAKIVARAIPLVYVNARPDSACSCAVLPENHDGMKAAVQHLIEHGHRRIAFAGNLSQFDLRERYAGYLSAHAEAGIEVDAALFLASHANLEMDGCEIGRRLLELGLPCTALVAGTDKLALGVLSELQSAGIEVPKRVALVGFDDIEKAQHVDPPLTTVKQSFGLIASIAMKTLLSHLDDGTPLPEVVRAPTVFVKRKSCGCRTSDSLPPFGPIERDADFEDRLIASLLAVAGAGQLTPVLIEQWPGARAIAELLVRAMNGDDSAEAPDLNTLWMDFLKSNRDAESIDKVVRLLEDAVRSRCATADSHAPLRSTLRDLRVSLMRNWRSAEQERNRYYEFVAESNGKINYALSTLRSTAAMDLSWLRWSRVQYACLGLWRRAPDGSRVLQIVGEYGAEGKPGRLGDEQLKASAFPPSKTCDLIRALGDTNVLTVVPLVGGGQSRGLLAVAAPIANELLDHVGNVGDWATQIGASLERAEVEQQLRKNADHDALTGLPNRSLLLTRIRSMTQDVANRNFAVALLDLDDFKVITDSMGHQAGDKLLVEVARRLETTLGSCAMIARLGGDEFAYVVPNVVDEAEVVSTISGIHAALRAPLKLNGDSVFASCSIGIAISSEQRFTAEELLRDADTAMHRAKLKGRARHEVFHRDMHAQAVERLRLGSRLRQALQDDEFTLVYQPILSLATGNVSGAEALIRWNHPEQGCLAPARFLAVAEDVGLAIPISKWVITTACQQAKTWQREGHPCCRVNVNVSTEHLQDPQFVHFIEQALANTGLAPQALSLELVESSLIDHRDSTTQVLARLMEMGVSVAIDDFGTGYSSLSYLKDFPISVLKIDRSFVQSLPMDPRDSAIATAIISMGHGLGLAVVAEGVESAEQLDFLRQRGCDMVQGFFISRPLSLTDCQRFLLEERAKPARRPTSDLAHPRRTGSDRPRNLTPAGGITFLH